MPHGGLVELALYAYVSEYGCFADRAQRRLEDEVRQAMPNNGMIEAEDGSLPMPLTTACRPKPQGPKAVPKAPSTRPSAGGGSEKFLHLFGGGRAGWFLL